MRACGGIFLGAMIVASAASQPPSIEVFTTTRYLIGTTDLPSVEVYRLDAPAALEADLSARLPWDSEIAAQLASAELQGAWRKSAETLIQAYQALFTYRRYGLQQPPAVILDTHWARKPPENKPGRWTVMPAKAGEHRHHANRSAAGAGEWPANRCWIYKGV